MNPQLVMKLVEKYKPMIANLVGKVKDGKAKEDYASFGKECEEVINAFLNISVKDLI